MSTTDDNDVPRVHALDAYALWGPPTSAGPEFLFHVKQTPVTFRHRILPCC
jgi:hypothetical protein